MLSVGTDIVEIKRIEKSIENPRFIARVFGSLEQAELIKKSAESYAAAFSAKESFGKALGTGIRGFSLTDVQLLHDELGAPYLHLSGKALEIAGRRGLEFSVSVSHTDSLATATVIAYQSERKLK